MGDAWTGRRVLITGGLGFIGSTLAHRLVALGARVHVVDSLDPQCGGNRWNLAGVADRMQVTVADVRTCLEHPEWIEGQDIVYNLAGQVSHLDSMEDPWPDYRANCQTHLAVLESCRTVNPTAKIVYAGTRGQYGRAGYLPVDESHPLQPLDVNGLHKTLGESYHQLYARQYGLRVVSLRLTNTYGPRHAMTSSRRGFLNWFVRLALDGEDIPVFGDGAQRRDFMYVDDAVEAFVAAADAASSQGDAYNVGSGEPVRVVDVSELICRAAGGGGTWQLHPYPPSAARIEVGDYWADIRKIRAALGWQPRVSLAEGIARTIDFYQHARRHYWSAAPADVTTA